MSEFRQRAIEDVARELVFLPEIIERACAKHEEDKTRWPEVLIALLVSQWERVLELEAAMGRILKRFEESDNGTLHVRDGVAWAMAADARHAITGEATHEA